MQLLSLAGAQLIFRLWEFQKWGEHVAVLDDRELT